MPLLHPSGGLLYHMRAWRWRRKLWAPFHAAVERWLKDWRPEATHLVLLGPSGGYALDVGFLSGFSRITVLEPDFLARRILKYRFPGMPFETADSAWLPSLEGFKILAQRYPDAAFLFCNLLGQQLVGKSAHDGRRIWLDGLALAMRGREWASWHDLASTLRPPNRSPVLAPPAAESLENVLAHFWQGGELEVHDHDCAGICPELPRQFAVWHLMPDRYHLIEWLCH
jgi:hypothetical protein